MGQAQKLDEMLARRGTAIDRVLNFQVSGWDGGRREGLSGSLRSWKAACASADWRLTVCHTAVKATADARLC